MLIGPLPDTYNSEAMFRRLSVAVVGLAALLTALAFITDARRTHAPKGATFEERLKQMSTTLEWRGAEEYRMAERYYPDFALSSEDYVQAAHDRDALPPARRTDKGGTATPIGDWHFVGPLDLDVPHNLYNGPGPAVGRVSSVQWGANDDTIYATGPGGAFVTQDAGTSWSSLGDGWPTSQCAALAVDPTNPTRMFAGTGDYEGINIIAHGIMRTTNTPGFWWTATPEQSADGAISDLVVLPWNPQVVIATSGIKYQNSGRVYRSADGGITWTEPTKAGSPGQKLPGGNWSDLVLSAPRAGGQSDIYASRVAVTTEIWRSVDGGTTFTLLSGSPTGENRQVRLTSSPTNPDRIYCLVSGKAVWRSDDAGANWTDITGDFVPDWWAQSSYNYAIEVVQNGPTGGEAVVVGQTGLHLCANPLANEGNGWTDIAQIWTPGPPGTTLTGSPALLHTDIHALSRNPRSPHRFLVGSDGGVFALTIEAGGKISVANLNRALPITQFYHASFHPTNPNVMIGGSQDSNTPSTSTQAKMGWTHDWDNVAGGDGGMAFIDPTNPSTQYLSWQYGALLRTNDNWTGFNPNDHTPWNIRALQPSPTSCIFVAPMALNPNMTNHLYYVGGRKLHRWDNNAGSWTMNIMKTPSGENVRVIDIPVGAPNRVYMGTYDGKLWAYDLATNQTQLLTNADTPKRTITDISVHPSDLQSILITYSGVGTDGHVFRGTVTGGTVGSLSVSWDGRDGSGMSGLPDIPTNTIERDPISPLTTWYVGSDVGVMMTTDAGATWKNATRPLGLPNVEVSHLEFVPSTGYLNCATFGRGIYRLRIGPSSLIWFNLANPGRPQRGGRRFYLNLNLNGPAPTGGVSVALSAFGYGRDGSLEPTNLVSLTSEVLLNEGQTSTEIGVDAVEVETSTPIVLQARLGVDVLQVQVDLVQGDFAVLVDSPRTVGGTSTTGRVYLESPATSPTRVSLASSDGSTAAVPEFVDIPAGQDEATFPVDTSSVLEDRAVTLTARKDGTSRTCALKVVALNVASIEFTSPSVFGGGEATGRVFLSAPSPGERSIDLSSDSAALSVPASLVVAPGQSSVPFTALARPVGSAATANVTARMGGGEATAAIQVIPLSVRGSVSYSDVPLMWDPTRPIEVRFREPGTTTTFETLEITPGPDGGFALPAPRETAFDVAVKASHWLRQTARWDPSVPERNLNFLLVNGDVNGDNTVNIADFLGLRSAFGSARGSATWNPMADLNEDGSVGIADFLILRRNLGSSGD